MQGDFDHIVPVVSPALNTQSGSHHAPDTKAYVVVHGTQDPCVSADTAFALGRNNGGENAVAYSIMPMNSGKDYKARATDVAQPIMAGGPVGGNQGGDYIVTPAIAFSAKDHGADATEELAPTLRAGGFTGSHQNGGVMPAVAFDWKMGEKARSIAINEEQSPTLGTQADRYAVLYTAMNDPVPPLMARSSRGGAQTLSPGHQTDGHMVAVQRSATPAIGWSEELTASVDLAGTLQRGGSGGRHDGVMEPTSAVRRLTPVECERLQGFPDNFTAIPWRKKGAEDCPDGPRYKALGNSMAVPVMRWIGERIRFVDDLVSLI